MMKRFWPKFELRVTLAYTIGGILWILFTDQLLASLITDVRTLTIFQTYKGLLYVSFSALLIFLLLRHHVRRWKLAETGLSESEAKYADVVERANDGIVIVKDNLIKFANPQLAQLLGYTLEKLMGTPYTLYIHPEELPKIKDRYTRRMRGEQVPPRYETRLVGKNGMVVDVELNAGIIPYQGKPADLVFVRDISERKEAEKALRESEARFRRLAENAQDLIYRYEFFPKRGFTYVSPIATAMTGYTPEEHYADPDLGIKIVHPEDRPLLEQYFQNQGVFHKPLTLRWIRKDGEMIWTEQRNVPIYDEKGNLIAIEGIARDVTERKKAETLLQKHTELEAFLANVSILCIHLRAEELDATLAGILTETGLFLHGDRSYIYLFDRSQNIFHPAYEWCAPEIPSLKEKMTDFPYHAFRETIEQFKKSEPICINQISDLPKEATLAKKILNTYHIQSLLIVPILWHHELKSVIGMDTIKIQRTWSQQDLYVLTTLANMLGLLFERITSETQIKKTLQEKETLLRELYHRTKNNMMVMSSLIALESERTQDEATRKILRELDSKIQTMALVHQKLYQSQDLSHVDLREYIPELVQLLVENYRVTPIDLSLKLAIEPIPVLYDVSIPLGLVINELVSNALKHAFINREKGEIEIQIKEKKPETIEVTFKDNGIGLPKPFQATPPTTLGFQTIFMIIENQLQGKAQWVSDHGLKWIFSFAKTIYRERV